MSQAEATLAMQIQAVKLRGPSVRIKCLNCDNRFMVKPSGIRYGKAKKYCGIECRQKALRVTCVCESCRKEFSVPVSRTRHQSGPVRFCSKACLMVVVGKKPNRICATCKKPFHIKPGELKRGRGIGTFCSRECMTGGRNAVPIDGGNGSHLEAAMYFQIKAAKLLGGMEREYRFHETRKWRFDFAWPDKKLAVEVQGGIWLGGGGGHTSGRGMTRDCEKYNSAALLGWRVLTVTSSHIQQGRALEWVERALKEAA